MTITKAHIAKKIADDCGFMKGEAERDLRETARHHEGKACQRGGRYDLWLREMVCEVQARPER